MQGNKNSNIETACLEHLQKQSSLISIFLMNGIRLEGVIHAFDEACILLIKEQQQMLIFKQAISTIVPDYRIMPIKI